jgi:hypothetical protein
MASRTNHERMIGFEMMDGSATAVERPKLGSRLGSSPKLLARKAMERASEILGDGEALEASFPQAPEAEDPALATTSATDAGVQRDGKVTDLSGTKTDSNQTTLSVTGAGGLLDPSVPPGGQGHAAAPTWSDDDESVFQALLTRRKAAGYQRRGRDVGGQLITVGTITANPNTVVAVIVAIVAEHGKIGRAKLVEAMANAIFPHPKAQPSDRGWCQGYVAGAVRNGFLMLSERPAAIVEAA